MGLLEDDTENSLFQKFKEAMTEDLINKYAENVATDLCLYEINQCLNFFEKH